MAEVQQPVEPKNTRKQRGTPSDGSKGGRGRGKGPAPGGEKVRRGPTFDDSKEEKQIVALIEKKKALYESIKEITGVKGGNSALNDEITELSKQLSEKKTQSTLLKNKKDLIKTQTDSLKNQFNELTTQFQEIKSSLPIKKKATNEELIAANIAHIDASIIKMETEDMNNAASVNEEREVLSRISSAKGVKKHIESIQTLEEAIRTKKLQMDALYEERDSLNEPLNTLKTEKEALFQRLQVKIEERNKTRKSRDAIPGIRAEIDQHEAQINALKEQKNARYAEWKKNQKELSEKRKTEYEERKKAREEAFIARKARQEQEDEERLNVPPFEKEIADCDRAASYLESIKNAPKQVIRHSINSIGLFDLISLRPPMTKDEIEASVTAVQEKKAYFIELQKSEIQRRKEAVAEKAAAAASSSSSSVEPSSEPSPVVESSSEPSPVVEASA